MAFMVFSEFIFLFDVWVIYMGRVDFGVETPNEHKGARHICIGRLTCVLEHKGARHVCIGRLTCVLFAVAPNLAFYM